MATHDVSMKIAHALEIGNVDIELAVVVDGKRLGRLKVSKGGLDWLPANKAVNSKSLTWESFAALMVESGKDKKLQPKNTKK